MADPDARYVSTERVVRDDVLVYAEGDEIPATDVDELKRQGYIADKAEKPKAPAKKATARKG